MDKTYVVVFKEEHLPENAGVPRQKSIFFALSMGNIADSWVPTKLNMAASLSMEMCR